MLEFCGLIQPYLIDSIKRKIASRTEAFGKGEEAALG